ncbi:MAG TPA: NAD(P)H-binding protein [Ramlibacter sp.]|nr:NAD(P)H-binding protein [Ramlibacter sp.]
MNGAASRSVAVAGATGLVGRELLQSLLADESVSNIVVIGRRAPAESHPKLQFQRVDLPTVGALPHVDECYIALGTTIKVAGSQDAFRAVDFDSVVNVASAAKSAGAKKLGVVSAMGANAKSGVFYSRVKGEMENALAALGFDTLVIARPSMLAGDRTKVGQPTRGGEELALKISNKLGWLIPANYRSIPAASVARALLDAVPSSKGRRVMPSGELQDY